MVRTCRQANIIELTAPKEVLGGQRCPSGGRGRGAPQVGGAGRDRESDAVRGRRCVDHKAVFDCIVYGVWRGVSFFFGIDNPVLV